MTGAAAAVTDPRSVRDALRRVEAALASIDAGAEARHLVRGVLGASGAGPLAGEHVELGSARWGELERATARRLAREPLAYVLGNAAFRDLTLAVDRRVLIPRPETELLVDAVIGLPVPRSARVLEVGVGSGAIALSLLCEERFERMIATDISADALRVARANAAALGLEPRLELREGEGYAPLGPQERFDVVVSNPPYVADGDRDGLPREVRDHEPSLALYAGDGLAVIRTLVRGAPAVLAPGGVLALEVGSTQGAAVRRMCVEAGLRATRVLQDLCGRDRIVLGRAA